MGTVKALAKWLGVPLLYFKVHNGALYFLTDTYFAYMLAVNNQV